MTAAASLVVLPAPAQAAGCSGSSGVSVVVDFNELGGGVQSACDISGGGQSASSLFTANGFALAFAQRQPGFVCRVAGVPASDPCQSAAPASAYWSLWWSDGTSGSWVYASLGATALDIPDGGYVAFSWKQGAAEAPPSFSPAAHSAAPAPAASATPSAQPTGSSTKPGKPGSKPGAGGDGKPSPTRTPKPTPTAPVSPGSTGSAGSAAPTESTGTSAVPTPTAGGASVPAVPTSPAATTSAPAPAATSTVLPSTPSSSASSSPSAAPGELAATSTSAPTSSPASASGAGLPGWVAPGVIGLLFVAAGATAVVRRRRSPHP